EGRPGRRPDAVRSRHGRARAQAAGARPAGRRRPPDRQRGRPARRLDQRRARDRRQGLLRRPAEPTRQDAAFLRGLKPGFPDFPRPPIRWEASDADGTRVLGDSSHFLATPSLPVPVDTPVSTPFDEITYPDIDNHAKAGADGKIRPHPQGRLTAFEWYRLRWNSASKILRWGRATPVARLLMLLWTARILRAHPHM